MEMNDVMDVGEVVQDSVEEIQSRKDEARLWKLEITQALSRESNWRKEAIRAYSVYTPESQNSNAFNIFWSNTETLSQAVFNSLPSPVVKRRYDDADPIGKASAMVLQRAIAFSIDTPTCKLKELGKKDVLSMLIPGRALSRLRYIPITVEEDCEAEEQSEPAKESINEYFSMDHSENFLRLDWEQIQIDRVQWDDLILGPAKTWEDVPWIGFRLKLKKKAVEEYFEDTNVTKNLPYNLLILSDNEKDSNSENEKEKQSGKVTEIWEIWDKEKREVIFISLHAEVPLKKLEDPFHLQAFYPCPQPLYAISRDNSTIPVTLYSQYRAQAMELNRITVRINKLINLAKVRGIYDSVVRELSTVTSSDDGILTPAEDVAQLRSIGGLEKAIWFMPLDVIVNTLRELIIQRNEIKQTIYEITGISDIMRAATQASETLGAQKLKVSWGSQRLQRLQGEVQSYFSSLLSLMGEMIAEHISLDTLKKMTLLPYRTRAEVKQEFEQAMQQFSLQLQQYQIALQQLQPPQQPPPPPQQPQPSNEVTWEDIHECIKSDTLRTFHISIDTDSTIAETQSIDLEELSKAMAAVAQVMTSFAPLVQEGVMPVEVVKELCLSVSRKARLGNMIEDALDKIQPPPPKPDPEEGKRETAKMVEEIRSQSKLQEKQFDLEIEKQRMILENQSREKELLLEAKFNELQARQEVELERQRQILQDAQATRENEMELQRSMEESASKERIANLEAQVEILTTKMKITGDIGIAEMDGINKLQVEQAKGANAHTNTVIQAAVTPEPEKEEKGKEEK